MANYTANFVKQKIATVLAMFGQYQKYTRNLVQKVSDIPNKKVEEEGFEPSNSWETGSPIFMILSPACPKALCAFFGQAWLPLHYHD